MTLTPKLFRRQVVDAARAGEPAAPRCPHAPPLGMCGGCTFQDRTYESQLAAKRAALRALWAGDLPNEMLEQIAMIGSPEPFEYRTRMDYVASKDRFGLRRGGKFNYIVELEQCHLIPPAAFAIARGVYELCHHTRAARLQLALARRLLALHRGAAQPAGYPDDRRRHRRA